MAEIRGLTADEWELVSKEINDNNPAKEKNDECFHFYIKDDQEAEWAMNKIREAEAEKAKWKEFYDSRYKAVCDSCDLTIANMQSLLQSYFATVPHKVTKTEENYALPSGKIYMKKQEPEFDTSGLLDYLKLSGQTQYIEYKEAPKWAEYKKTLAKDPEGNFAVVETEEGLRAVNKDGEPLPIPVTLKQPEFKVQIKKEK